MSEHETASFLTGYHQLGEELANGTPSPRIRNNTIPLPSIYLQPMVFQPRSIEDLSSSEGHITTLMNAAMNESGNVLDPLVVWWSGSQWIVLDGHHRYEAYQRLKKKGKGANNIPVKVFNGSLKQAVIESTKLNAKDKLPMTKDDKATRAWQLVVIGEEFSKKEIAEVCKVGSSTVGRMRARLEELKELYLEEWTEKVEGLSWKEVMNLGSPVCDYDDDWKEQQALNWARRLAKTFGDKPAGQAEIFARAIELYSPNLSGQLTEWYSYDPDDSDF